MIDEQGEVQANALKLRITDQYLEALDKIYNEVKLVGLPQSGSEGGQVDNLATALVLIKHF